ncbi:MAG: TetR family transcriptional regulator [Actinomycetota bacterium]
MTRKYELKERAESQAATRRRIVEAAFELHTTLGPARTTISAIAERAGVQRLTVYRHFPDERSLFRACTSHSWAADPRPDPELWAAISDPEERLRVALSEIYSYFRRTEQLTANVRRDLPDLPVLQEIASVVGRYWEDVRAVLDRGWAVRGRRRVRVRAAVGHAIQFETWRSLVRGEKLHDAAAVELMVMLVRAL